MVDLRNNRDCEPNFEMANRRRAQPRFDYEPIRIEGGRLDHSRTFFAHRTKSR
jgi:hypothetical protein